MSAASTPPPPALRAALEALLFATDRPLSTDELAKIFATAVDEEEWPEAVEAEALQAAIDDLRASLQEGGHGVELILIDGRWRLRTVAELAPIVRRLWPGRPTRLSKAALEVLSIVAYQQPCTRADVEAIRGVDCGGVMRSLLERKLVRIAGKRDEPGRPLLYATSPTFLEVFGLPDLKALPTLRDLESLRAEAEAKSRGSTPDVESARAAKRGEPQPEPTPSGPEPDAPEGPSPSEE